ncbi:hypothetical protein [Bradyrhizobium sp. CCGE-LA001]|uniref:hypothetical protein n=1 Tax=Bradyrhizobium sp. CCGE-LA001 TaxID=1223566 RepID=UPI000745DB6B|nr:hypothetical protein [Bradyrhizobium sp. CCGE-LA001]AMA55041.1 hypothetical protein BCCGELA001_01310 [Bradyrhizobium sp. CCGE-LA001]
MTNRYYVGQLFFNADPPIEISRAEYDGAVDAVQGLLHSLDAEEKYDNLLENYRELEEFIVGQSLRSLLSIRIADSNNHHAPRSTTGRKLSNFLSSVRLYQDSVERHAVSITGDTAIGPMVHEEKSSQFDRLQSYRTLEALRNHAQHFALPVHGFTVALRRTDDLRYVDHEFSPEIHVDELALNPRFSPAKTLVELQAGPNRIKLKPLVREYVQSLSAIHEKFRQLTWGATEAHLDRFRELKSRLFFRNSEIDDIGIAVFPGDKDGHKTGAETNLSAALPDALTQLRDKNCHLVNFAARRVAY